MSRIANAAISIPNGVECKITSDSFFAKGPKGQLSIPLPFYAFNQGREFSSLC